MNKYLKYLLCTLILVLVNIGYASRAESTFLIDIGSKKDQIGTRKIDYAYVSPCAITEGNGNVYILDIFNFKINVYTKSGQYKNSYIIPKKQSYNDLAVDIKGNIYLLTDSDIYVIPGDEKSGANWKLPSGLTSTYSLYVDNKSNMSICGLRNNGLDIIGIIDGKGCFKELQGYNVFLTQKGLVGLQKDDNSLVVLKNGVVTSELKLNPDLLLIGFTDDLNLYYAKPTKTKDAVEIRRVDINGNVFSQIIDYSFELITDAMCYQQVFYVNPNGEVIMMDLVDKKVKVTRVNL